MKPPGIEAAVAAIEGRKLAKRRRNAGNRPALVFASTNRPDIDLYGQVTAPGPNTHRPHQALDDGTPMAVWRAGTTHSLSAHGLWTRWTRALRTGPREKQQPNAA
jgi:hypothetical protein